MALDLTYEEITSSEADFIISIYYAISKLVSEYRPVTLVGLGNELNVTTEELSDYLHFIVAILDKVEEEQI